MAPAGCVSSAKSAAAPNTPSNAGLWVLGSSTDYGRPKSFCPGSALFFALANGEALTIVDSRSPAAFTSERIPGAINLPFPDISPTGTGHLDPNRIYVCYCDGIGSSGSTKVAVRLMSLGFSVRELIGGLDWWKREGYGTEVSDDQSSAGAA